MTSVEFYVLADTAPDAHLRQACRIAEQAVDRGERVLIRVDDAAIGKRMDDLLWTFGDRSFLPHEFAEGDAPSNPHVHILIGNLLGNGSSGNGTPSPWNTVTINLSSDVAPAASGAVQPSRIVELVPTDSELKRAARARFKTYRDAGIEPTTQNL